MTRIPPHGRAIVGLFALAAGVLCLVVVAIPIAEDRGMAGASWIRLALRPACHQIGDRCLDLGSGPLAVCARCSGLYAGAFLGLLVTATAGRRFRPPWALLGAAAAPTVIDFVLGQLGLPSLDNWPRFWAAFVPGLLLGLLLADAAASLARKPAEPEGRSIT